jgi:hypothetical protein
VERCVASAILVHPEHESTIIGPPRFALIFMVRVKLVGKVIASMPVLQEPQGNLAGNLGGLMPGS